MSGSKVDVKIVLLGKEYGGKTSLVERYLHNRYNGSVPYQNTIGAAYGAKRVEVFGTYVVMGIWDTAGSERYHSMSRIYYRDAWAAVVCFDLTDAASFDKTRFWVGELRNNEPRCRIYLCGTKKDLISDSGRLRQFEMLNILEFADSIGATIYETSSKTGENVSEIFERIAKDYVKSMKEKSLKCERDDELRLNLDDKRKSKKKCNC